MTGQKLKPPAAAAGHFVYFFLLHSGRFREREDQSHVRVRLERMICSAWASKLRRTDAGGGHAGAGSNGTGRSAERGLNEERGRGTHSPEIKKEGQVDLRLNKNTLVYSILLKLQLLKYK